MTGLNRVGGQWAVMSQAMEGGRQIYVPCDRSPRLVRPAYHALIMPWNCPMSFKVLHALVPQRFRTFFYAGKL